MQTLRPRKFAKSTLDLLFGAKVISPKTPQGITQEYYELIQKSGYFDRNYYLSANADVKKSGMDPLLHYLLYGGLEGRKPSAVFDSDFYLRENADVRELQINPLVHFILVGAKEQRLTMPLPRGGAKARRNRSGSKRVDIINVNFYDASGAVLYKGGAERYVFDLACILKSMGHRPRLLQNAVAKFARQYRGIDVVGVVTGVSDTSGKSIRTMSRAFNDSCRSADLIIASPIDLACEVYNAPVIGVNHGIHWDTKFKSLANNRTSDYMEIFDALENIQAGICVDTNFINWTRTYDYRLAEKLKYVPNYYDKSEFRKNEKEFHGRLRVMYPRRLYDARGIYITLEAFDHLLKSYDDIDLLLVGQTNDEDVKRAVGRLIKKYPTQVTLEEYDMEDMHLAYGKSNVVLIPTRYAEGTSLSCLEAMATNNALIATNIGGLPNLVIDHYNGLLIDPNTRALIEAVEALRNDRDLAAGLARRALNMVNVFEKKNWDDRWRKVLEEIL